MSNTISPKFSPKESRPSRSSHKPNRGKRAACAAPFASEPREWHLDLIRQRASICTELAELAPRFHGTKFSTLPGSQLGDPKSCNEDGQEAWVWKASGPVQSCHPEGCEASVLQPMMQNKSCSCSEVTLERGVGFFWALFI